MARDRNGKSGAGLSARGRMYLVLALCCLMILAASLAALWLIGPVRQDDGGSLTAPTPAPVDQAPLVAENDYDMTQNTIDTDRYSATILPQSEDAGQSYIDETLFLGDSNTARLYRMFDFCTSQNAVGSVGMTAGQLQYFACVGFSGGSGYVTMPQAVALLQPRRVLITFGTNDLNPRLSTQNFIKDYQAGIEAVQSAYPSVDIIVNAIPPLGREHSGQNLTQSQVDEFNRAIVTMCEEKEWKFLNSAEALKDPATGFARDEYIESSDGIHLTREGMEALLTYFRTHSYILEDDRPPLAAIPVRSGERDVVVYREPVVATAAPDGTEPGAEGEEPPMEEEPGEDPAEGSIDIGGDSAEGTEPAPEAPAEAPTDQPAVSEPAPEVPADAPTAAPPAEVPTDPNTAPAAPEAQPPADSAADAGTGDINLG